MAARKKATVTQVFAPKCDNPIVEAKALYDQFKVNHGHNPILDQAIRLTSHSVKTNWEDKEVTDKTMEAIRLTDMVDNACSRVAIREGATKQDKAKAKLVRDIHTYLYDCI